MRADERFDLSGFTSAHNQRRTRRLLALIRHASRDTFPRMREKESATMLVDASYWSKTPIEKAFHVL